MASHTSDSSTARAVVAFLRVAFEFIHPLHGEISKQFRYAYTSEKVMSWWNAPNGCTLLARLS